MDLIDEPCRYSVCIVAHIYSLVTGAASYIGEEKVESAVLKRVILHSTQVAIAGTQRIVPEELRPIALVGCGCTGRLVHPFGKEVPLGGQAVVELEYE